MAIQDCLHEGSLKSIGEDLGGLSYNFESMPKFEGVE